MSIEPRLTRDPTVRLFWAFAALHFVLWLLICFLTQPNMPLDMVEMLYWGEQWELGYHKHPPLPAWITAFGWWLGGGSHLLMYGISQLTILATFWAVWQLAREGLSPRAALCSVILLQGCYYCTFMINDINNTIITRPFWSLTILFLYRALTREANWARNLNWILAGLAIGLGMNSKYYIGVLVLSLLSVPVLIPQTRSSLKTIGPYLLTGMALLVFLPHLIWMTQNDFVTIQYIFHRSEESSQAGLLRHFTSPLGFIGSQLGAVVPMLVLAWPMLREGKSLSKSVDNPQSKGHRFFQRYVSIAVFGPLAIYLMISLVMGTSIRSMWGGPLFSFFGVWLFSRFELPQDQQKVRKILRDSLIVGLCMLGALALRNVAGPVVRGKLSRVHFPGVEAAEKVNSIWRSRFDSELEVIGGHMFIAGSISAYTPQHVDVYADLSQGANPWITDQEFSVRGGIIVWRFDGDQSSPPEGWMERFPGAELFEPIELTSQALLGTRELKVGVILVPPRGNVQSEFSN